MAVQHEGALKLLKEAGCQVTDENMVANGEWLGAAAMLDEARDRQAFSF